MLFRSLPLLPGLLLWAVPPALALPSSLRGADGSMYFQQSPSLDRVVVQPKKTHARGSRLEITLTVPSTAQVPLQSILLDQHNNPERLTLNPTRIEAVVGDHWRFDAPRIPVQVQSSATDPDLLEIRWPDAVQPGTTLTLGLPLTTSPTVAGVYSFGVTAFPQGDKPHPYFLGYGSVNFDDRSDTDAGQSWQWTR